MLVIITVLVVFEPIRAFVDDASHHVLLVPPESTPRSAVGDEAGPREAAVEICR